MPETLYIISFTTSRFLPQTSISLCSSWVFLFDSAVVIPARHCTATRKCHCLHTCVHPFGTKVRLSKHQSLFQWRSFVLTSVCLRGGTCGDRIAMKEGTAISKAPPEDSALAWAAISSSFLSVPLIVMGDKTVSKNNNCRPSEPVLPPPSDS